MMDHAETLTERTQPMPDRLNGKNAEGMPPVIAEERDLAEQVRVELRYFAHHVRALDPSEAERAIEDLTDDFIRMAREHTLKLTRALQRKEPGLGG